MVMSLNRQVAVYFSFLFISQSPVMGFIDEQNARHLYKLGLRDNKRVLSLFQKQFNQLVF